MHNPSARPSSLLCWMAIFVLGGLAAAQDAPVPPPTKQDLDLIKMATALDPYSKSAEARQNPESLGVFFPKALYPKLLGNPIMGYLYDEGYSSGGQKVVKIGRYKIPKKMEAHSAAFKQCVQTACAKAGLRLGVDGRLELGVALVGVVPVKSDKSMPGVCVEFYVRNRDTGKTVFARRSFGSKTLIQAMMDAAVYMAVRAGQ